MPKGGRRTGARLACRQYDTGHSACGSGYCESLPCRPSFLHRALPHWGEGALSDPEWRRDAAQQIGDVASRMLGCVANGVAAAPSMGESLGYVPRGQGVGHGDSGGH
jgi:hypothetical protein